jgi:hypothetical protein
MVVTKTKETTTLKINKSETKKPQIIQKKTDVQKNKKTRKTKKIIEGINCSKMLKNFCKAKIICKNENINTNKTHGIP